MQNLNSSQPIENPSLFVTKLRKKKNLGGNFLWSSSKRCSAFFSASMLTNIILNIKINCRCTCRITVYSSLDAAVKNKCFDYFNYSTITIINIS
ncbi:hypothetical protein BpHYR1_027238 [Brachionus plicatilis]|uniref:Uncharacterized protein n=1 Tax=Brachionus plicatilis TaxID=10195 RepID=A0A3M7SNR1_BRAPC|nr:hypothetical protein BpHYR1_027238 [Brachionus plicatilis]